MLRVIKDEIIKRGSELGLTRNQIGYLLGLSGKAVYTRKKALNLLDNAEKVEINKEDILDKFKKGSSYNVLAKEYSLSYQAIGNIIRENLSRDKIREISYKARNGMLQ